MKKLVKPTICAALSFVLMFTSVQWSGILAGPRRVNAEASKDVKEVIDSESTKNSTTFRLSNGKKESVFYGQDVRYEDENGNLKDYDPTLVEIKDKTSGHGHNLKDYQYENKDGDKKQYLPKKLTESTPVLMEHDKYEISFAPITGEEESGIMTQDQQKEKTEENAFSCINKLKRTKLQREEVLTAEDKKEELPVSVAYESEDKNCTFLYQSLDTGVKESVTLKEIPDSNQLKFRFYAKNLTAKKNIGDGGITFYDKESEDIIASLEAPSMNDDTKEAYSEKLSYDIEPIKDEKDTYELTLTLDEEYLKDKDRKYPITIDPTVTWNGSTDFWDVYVINGSYKNTNFYDSGVTAMMAGKASKGTYRTYLRFKDFTAKIKNKYVDTATLTMYETGDSTSGQTIEARRVTSNWSRPGLTWSNRPGYSTNYGSVTTTGTTHKARSINLTKYARECANGSITSYGVMLKNADETKKYGQFYSSRYSNASYRPKMSVTYYDGPTTPTSASVTPQYMKKGQTLTAKWAGISSKSLNRVEYRVATFDPAKNVEVNSNYRAYSGSTKLGTTGSGSASVADSKNWPEGCYKFVIRGVDNGGINGTGKGYIFYVDGAKPVIHDVIVQGEGAKGITEDNPSSDIAPVLSWHVSDTYLSKVEYKVENGSYINLGNSSAGSIAINSASFNENRSYTVTIRVTDKVGNQTEKTVQYYYEDKAKVSDYQPTEPEVKSSYGKALISWKQSSANLPGSIYYEVHWGESADFTPDDSNLVRSAVKDTYVADMNTGDGKEYYYKVCAVKLAKSGKVLSRSNYVTTGKVRQQEAREFEQYLGEKDYRDTLELSTPNGTGTIDKASGNLTYSGDDFDINVGGMGLSLTRTYNSQSKKAGMLGNGWYDTFHKQLYQVGDNLIFQDSDGTYITFEKNGNSYTSKETKDYTLSLTENNSKASTLKNAAKSTVLVNTRANNILGRSTSRTATYNPSHNTKTETGEIQPVISEKSVIVVCTLTDKNNTTYQFDANGHMTGMEDANGNYVLYGYNEKGQLETVTSNKNQTLTLKYNGGDGEDADRLKEIVLPDETKVSYTYEKGNLIKATHSSKDGGDSVVYHYAYDSEDHLINIQDAKGNDYGISYQGQKASKVTKPNGSYQQLTYGDGTTAVSNHKNGGVKLSEDSITYDTSNGKLLSATDVNGITTTYNYADASNNLLQTGTTAKVYYQTLTDGVVNFASDDKITTSTTYNADENVVKEVDETGQVTTTTYGDSKNKNLPTNEVTSNEDGKVSNVTTTYDENGNPLTEKDSVADTETKYLYDNKNNWEMTDEWQYEEGEEISHEKVDSEELDHEVKESSTLTQGKIEEISTAKQDNMGREIYSKDEKTGEETSISYDFMGRVTKSVKSLDGISQTEVKSYDANGMTVSETSNTGITTSYEYDSLNRVTTATESADGKTKTTKTAYGYEDANIHTLDGTKVYQNLAVQTVTTNGTVTSKSYTDSEGNVVRTLNDGIYTDYVFTGDGKEIASIVLGTNKTGKEKVTVQLFDKEGNQTHIIRNPNVTAGNITLQKDTIVTKAAYDANGNETAETDGKGNETTYTYDDQNRITGVSQDGGNVSSTISYAMLDGKKTTSITDAKGHVNMEVTNEAGLTESSIDQGDAEERISTKYSYDDSGNKIKETFNNGAYKAYSYDKKNRITKTESFEAPEVGESSGTRTLKTAYRYDAQDRLLEAIDYSVVGNTETAYRYTEYTYDSRGNVTSFAELSQESQPTAEEISAKKIRYVYDSEGKLTKVAYPTIKDGVQGLTYEYNENGWLIKVEANVKTGESSTEKTIRSYSYDSFGKVKEIKDYRNILSAGDKAVRKIYTYDSFDRVKEMIYTDLEHPDTVMESYTYEYDKNSNITKKTEVNNYPPEGEKKIDESKDYTYDALGRLTKTITTNHKKDDEKKTTTYEYDKVGNRTLENVNEKATSYNYNGLDQALTATKYEGVSVSEQIQYEYDANGNEISQHSTKTGETTRRSYDAENRLSKVSVEKDGKTMTIQENQYNGEGQRIRKTEGDTVRNYYYQDGVVSYTTDAAKTQTSQNLIGLERNIIGTERYDGNQTSYYMYNKDIQGSTTSLVKEDGSADATYQYTDFGETTISGANQARNEICYTGGIYDKTTAFYYLNARYYNPEGGRFATEDTYRGEPNDQDTYHLYTYCANNPINDAVPSGHKKEWISKKKGNVYKRSFKEMRICTDGRIANKYEKKKKRPYEDKNHQGKTACFGNVVASDAVPYIVIPSSMKKYKFSSGVIVNRKNGDYMYAVVGETGGTKPVGEVSIYAAWKMNYITPPKNHQVYENHRIGNKSQNGRWKIILFQKSAPNSKKAKSGWKYKKTSTLNPQIKSVGQKCYKGTGKCLN